MANNYTMTSAFLDVPEAQLERAREICERIEQKLEDDEDDYGYCGIQWEVENKVGQTGVWFSNEESANVEHMEIMAREVIEELKIDAPFQASWANTCSKPRIDNFDGGSFVIVRGHPTIWVNAQREAEKQAAGLVAQDWPNEDPLDGAMKSQSADSGPKL